ncbi:MAG TPA: phosphoglycerate dehydrogenase [Acidimicrobiales bacterium]|jgi:D-3-phosphoglycerate dehydrogenase|nr:phosphoglycerate dehydrogenase [Acidimicrobiales bacterium]
MSRILVTEKIADPGLDRLRAAGHEVDVRENLSPDELLDAVRGAHGLIIRSATQVTADVLAAGIGLVVVGRAGIGLDNVDVEAATRQGVMVVNAPQSNVISAAEHTMALILAQARNVPQSHAALTQGRWERSKWEGVELNEKTLGIIGLGRIGKLVAQRALAFGMRLIAYDPYVSADRARQMSVELVELDELVTRADFITIHVAKTPQTVGLINAERLAKAKPNLRVINVARGGIVDEAALAEAIVAGRVAGAALDVFSTEPMTESPLFGLESVVVTPHLGASTFEAQDKAGNTIAEQVLLALDGEFVPFAVNVDASEASETVRPFLPLAEHLGGLFASLAEKLPGNIDVEFQGEIGGYDNKITLLSAVKGMLSQISDEPVSFVNALHIARDRGVEVRGISTSLSKDYVNVITVRGGGHALAGTLVGLKGEPRLVMVDDHAVDMPPSNHMLVVRNDDRPGMIGFVGTVLGAADVNIDDMDVGRSADGIPAVMVIATPVPVPASVQDTLRAHDGIISVHAIDLR